MPRWSNVRRDLRVAYQRANVPSGPPNDLRQTFGSPLYNQHGIDAAHGPHEREMVRLVYGQIGKDPEC